MEVQLKELIDKIKNDGVKSAEEKAEKIIRDAEERAAAILKKAEADAAVVRNTAKADAEKAERSGNEALRQAGRDLVLTVKGEIEALFSKVLESRTASALDAELMADAVSQAVKNLSDIEAADADVFLPEDRMAELESAVKTALSDTMASGLEIKPFKGLDAGFRVSRKDGSAFFDFSEREIAAMLGRYLNPRLTQLLSD